MRLVPHIKRAFLTLDITQRVSKPLEDASDTSYGVPSDIASI